LLVAAPELVPPTTVAGRVAREDGRQVGILQLERIARENPYPRPSRCRHRSEADDVVLDDRVRLQLVEDLAQAVVDVPGAADELLPDRQHEALELVDRRLPKDRRRLAHEIL